MSKKEQDSTNIATNASPSQLQRERRINAAKNFHEAAGEVTKIGISAVQQQTTISTQKESKKEKD